MVSLKRIGAGATIAGALAFTALGLGSGVSNADQPLPTGPGITWKLDRDDDWEDWDRWNRGRGWYEPGWRAAPVCGAGVWVPPAVWQWVPPAVWGC
jgi:hypothetical protein